jgi:hypothetical protein
MIPTAEEAAEFVALVYAVGLRRAGLMIEVPPTPDRLAHRAARGLR